MENFSFSDFKPMDSNNLEASKNELFDRLKNNPLLLAYLEKTDYNLDDVKNNVNKFNILVHSLETCKGCKGMEYCQNSHPGYFEDIISDNDYFDIQLVSCKHKKENDKKEEYLKAYVYTDFQNELMDLDIKKIIKNIKPLNEDDEIEKYYRPAWTKIVEYLKDFDKAQKGIYLWGDYGVGKTWLMIALCNSLVSKGKSVAFVNATRLVSKCNGKNNDKLINDLSNVDFLVLDDIGQESVSSFTRDDLLFPILDNRMLRHKQTCFTSNVDMKSLEGHFSHSSYGDKEDNRAGRIMERIKGLSEPCFIKGFSRR